MFFIRTHNKSCGLVASVKCPNCGKVTTFVKFRRKRTGSFLFIPFISVTNFAFVQCQECQAAYEVSKKSIKNISNGDELMNEVMAWHNKKQGKKKK